MIEKSDNEIEKFWNRKKCTHRRTGPNSMGPVNPMRETEGLFILFCLSVCFIGVWRYLPKTVNSLVKNKKVANIGMVFGHLLCYLTLQNKQKTKQINKQN